MRQGTVTVCEQLEPMGINASKAEIEEALYYYFYDIEKSVGYIKSRFLFHQQLCSPVFRCLYIFAMMKFHYSTLPSSDKPSPELLHEIEETFLSIPTNSTIDQHQPKEPKKKTQQKTPSKFDQAAAVAKSKTVDQPKGEQLFPFPGDARFSVSCSRWKEEDSRVDCKFKNCRNSCLYQLLI